MPDAVGAKVVVGVSRSMAGLAALRFAVTEATRRGVPLYAIRSWPFQARWHGPSAAILRQQFTDEAERLVTEAFDAAMGGLPAGLDVVVATPCGRADLVLTEVADGAGDLLVLGGRSGWWRWPSWVVRGCERHARCPVAVVPPPELARARSGRFAVRRFVHEATRLTDGLRAR